MIVVAFIVLAAIGALLRAFLGQKLNRINGFAWGTFVTNVTGAFALGLLAHTHGNVATVLGVGLIGTYTTFSSFARDAIALVEQHKVGLAFGYVIATTLCCVSLAYLALPS